MRAFHPHGGRHELGQNLLVDRRAIAAIVAEVAAWPPGPITEFAAGRGALTAPLAARGRRVTAVELDARLAEALRRRAPARVEVVVGDMLEHPLPSAGGVVANVPFHITTPWLRRLLAGDGWERALLLVQWEVARKRAGIGGTTLLTARWWPWYAFSLAGRVPARAFRPRPSVDGGLLRVERRARPLLDPRVRRDYQRFVERAFTGSSRDLRARLRAAGLDGRARNRDLDAEAWAALYRRARGGEVSSRRRPDTREATART